MNESPARTIIAIGKENTGSVGDIINSDGTLEAVPINTRVAEVQVFGRASFLKLGRHTNTGKSGKWCFYGTTATLLPPCQFSSGLYETEPDCQKGLLPSHTPYKS